MKGKMGISGDQSLVAQFRYLSFKVPDNARKVMHRQTDKVVEMAKMMAPEDDAELTDSIHKEVSYESRGRLKIDVVAGGVVRGVNVDRYVALIHENYESMQPGEITLLKRQIYPDVYVGGKFLDRAIEKSRPKLEAAMIGSVIADMKVLEQ